MVSCFGAVFSDTVGCTSCVGLGATGGTLGATAVTLGAAEVTLAGTEAARGGDGGSAGRA